jgi:hypothetical protein
LKLTTPKAPGTNEKRAKDSGKSSKPKSERKKSKAAASDEDLADEEVKEPEKELDPAEAKAKKEKEGRFAAPDIGSSAYDLQFSSSDTNFRKAFCLASKRPKKVKWPLCPISSQNSKITETLKLASSVPPR